MNAQEYKKILDMMRLGVERGVFPGGVLLGARDMQIRFFEAVGHANLFSGERISKNTVFDLASMSKPLATALSIMRLVDMGRLRPEMRLKDLLSPFSETSKRDIRIEQLLAHCSGLPAWRPYYLRLRELSAPEKKNALRRFLVQEPLEYAPESQVIYSDLGFMILEWVVEKFSGMPLNQFAEREVYAPLNLSDRLFFSPLHENSLQKKGKKFAATEKCPWRGKVLSGEVHDDNAWSVGGFSGHAGLFGDAEAVFSLLSELVRAFAGESRLFSKETTRRFLSPYNKTGRGLGFDRPSPGQSAAGSFFSGRAVGHLGFTGTSFWVEPDGSAIVILLTNRVHPIRDNQKIQKFRPLIHNALMRALF